MAISHTNTVLDVSRLTKDLREVLKEHGKGERPIPDLDWAQFETVLRVRLGIPPEKGASKYEPVEFYALILACFHVIHKFSPGFYELWKRDPNDPMKLNLSQEALVKEYYKRRWGNVLGGIAYITMNTTGELLFLQNESLIKEVVRMVCPFRKDVKIYSPKIALAIQTTTGALSKYLGPSYFSLASAVLPICSHAIDHRLMARSKKSGPDRLRIENMASIMFQQFYQWVGDFCAGFHEPAKANVKYASQWYKA